MGRDDSDLTGGSRRRGWLRPTATKSAVVVATSMVVVGGATASFGATHGRNASANSSFLACEVTDTGGINDRSFNASAYQGLKVAAAAIPGLTYTYLGSTSTSDYTPNINTFIGENCGIIVTVGFDMASRHPDGRQEAPDPEVHRSSTTPTRPAIRTSWAFTTTTNQDAFLGGYLAAAMSKTRHGRHLRRAEHPDRHHLHGRLGRRCPLLRQDQPRQRDRPRLDPDARPPAKQPGRATACSPTTSPTRPSARPTRRPSLARVPTSSSRWPVPSAWARPRRSSRPAPATTWSGSTPTAASRHRSTARCSSPA